MTRAGRLAVAGLAAALVAGGVLARPRAAQRPQPPGMGVLCMSAIVSGMAEVGRRCPGTRDPAIQPALEQGERALDRYVRVNGDASDADIATFKRRHSLTDRPAAELCKGDALLMYRQIAKQGSTTLTTSIRDLTARSGKPEWGDCL